MVDGRNLDDELAGMVFLLVSALAWEDGDGLGDGDGDGDGDGEREDKGILERERNLRGIEEGLRERRLQS